MIKFINSVVADACSVIQTVLNAFGSDLNLNCGSGKKRGLFSTGWLPTLNVTITRPWFTLGGATACGIRMATVLNTSTYDYQDNDLDQRELIFCLSAYQWLPAARGGIADTIPGGATAPALLRHTCDWRMPEFYTSGDAFPNLSTEEQAFAYSTCVLPRMMMERARLVSGVDWAPTDLLYNFWARAPLVVDDLAYGYSVYSQYSTDRSTVPSTSVGDAGYASNWQASGYATDHLAAVARVAVDPATGLVNATLVDALFSSDNTTYGLSIEQYAARASAPGKSWRARDPTLIAGTARFWRNLFGSGAPPANDAPSGTILSSLGTLFMSAVERLANQTILAPPPFAELKFTALTATNVTERTRKQFNAMGMRAVLYEPWIVVARAAVRYRDANLTRKGLAAASALGQAAIAATTLAQEFVSGAAYDAALTLDSYVGYAPPTTAWRLWPRLQGGLSHWTALLYTELGSVAQTVWTSGPQQVVAAASALSTRSASAAGRRDRMGALGTFLTTTALAEWYAFPLYYYLHGRRPLLALHDTKRLIILPG